MMSVFETVQAIIAEKLNVEKEKVTLEAALAEDLGADSLDAIEIVMALEDEFGLSLDADSTQNIKTVNDLVSYIEAHK